MTREEYLSEVFARLSHRMPGRELDKVMHYYEEYFDEAGLGHEAEVMADLGTPADLTRKIMGESPAGGPMKYRYDPERRGGRRWTAGKILLLVCLSPLWGSLVLAVLVAMFGTVLCFGAGGVGCVFGGAFSVLCGFTALFTPGIATTLLFSGAGLAMAGLGIAMLAGTTALGCLCVRGTASFFRWMFFGGKGGRKE